ncbi:shikimate kinase AroK [Aquicella lusitana]|uniref:Shikimate kinase n=1 Tax=Aquicella lusitana TaxID=254246 RepID=A0A370H0Z6_9COXI|nr:shikimate kinase AroK [Aquicella lusitana]RDI48644.1 shikimate kinase [Aquicella lusitana]VVC73979.1 Shikimate kinase 1 [Aquicella lusitana]
MKDRRKNIFLVGPMGAGKTSVGRYLAKQLNKDFYDSDEEIEKKMGVSLTWIFDLEGMAGFRLREMKVIDELSALPDIVLSTGGGCVETPEVREILRQRGLVIYMEVSLKTQLDRLKRDKKRPLLQGNNPQEVLERLWEEREPIYEGIADLTVLTDSRSVRDVCEDILAWLEKHGLR